MIHYPTGQIPQGNWDLIRGLDPETKYEVWRDGTLIETALGATITQKRWGPEDEVYTPGGDDLVAQSETDFVWAALNTFAEPFADLVVCWGRDKGAVQREAQAERCVGAVRKIPIEKAIEGRTLKP